MGAGIIIVNKQGMVLALKTLSGKWDFPKGTANSGETSFETAQRETEEECCLFINQKSLFFYYPITYDNLSMFLAKYSGEDPKIGENEKGEKEHSEWKWLYPQEMLENCLDFLKAFGNHFRKKIYQSR